MVKPSSKVIASKPKSGGSKAAPVNSVSISGGKTERSVDIRKIENGYIVRESTYGPKGYKSTERFTDKAPTISMAPAKGKK